MKTSMFLLDDFSVEERAAMQAIASTNDASFSNLVKLGHFDPTSDFRYSNLQGFELDGADLRGFDFTGADLRNARGDDVLWDETTILTGAATDGSLFDRDGGEDMDIDDIERLAAEHWSEQIIVLDRAINSGDIAEDELREIAIGLFYASDDSFVRRQALQSLAEILDFDHLIEMIQEELLAPGSDVRDIATAMHVLEAIYDRDTAKTGKLLVALLKTQGIAPRAAAILARKIVKTQDLMRLGHYIGRLENSATRTAFLGSLAKRLGPVFELIVRDPEAREIWDYGSEISQKALDLIVRNIAREIALEKDRLISRPRPFIRTFGLGSKAEIEVSVRNLYGVLNRYGTKLWTRSN